MRRIFAIGLVVFADLAMHADVPSNIRTVLEDIRDKAKSEAPGARAAIFGKAAAELRFQFPEQARVLALEAERNVDRNDVNSQVQIYQLLLDLDAERAHQFGWHIRDKNLRYGADVQHCREHGDFRCGQQALITAITSGAYHVGGAQWVLDQLVLHDRVQARSTYSLLLSHFPVRTAGFRDVSQLLDASAAIAAFDPSLARRGAKIAGAAADDPRFEDRTEERVEEIFSVNGRRIQTANARRTVQFEVRTFLESGTFPKSLSSTFSLKHPSGRLDDHGIPSASGQALLSKLEDRVQTLNDFVLSDMDGRRIHLKDLRGRPVLLNFWATWCPPCIQEMPQLEQLQKQGVTVLAISDEDGQVVRRFASPKRYTFSIFSDPKGEVFQAYDVVLRPTSILIDRSGQIVDRWIGPPKTNVLREAFEESR